MDMTALIKQKLGNTITREGSWSIQVPDVLLARDFDTPKPSHMSRSSESLYSGSEPLKGVKGFIKSATLHLTKFYCRLSA